MSITSVQKLINLIEKSFRELGLAYQQSQLEEIAVIVHEAMTGPCRRFHTLDHVFDIAKGAGPLEVLSAVFHDVVYYAVDGGFSSRIEALLQDYVLFENHQVFVKSGVGTNEPAIALVLQVFDIKPGQELVAQQGLNEFLSSVVAIECLKKILSLKQLAALVCCIEASIPFRGVNAQGASSFDQTKERLVRFLAFHQIKLDAREISEIIKCSVSFANRDVKNFADKNPGRFLANTWLLLPEANHVLNKRSFYSIKSYRMALEKMEGFFNSLSPEKIFHSYDDYPSPKLFLTMQKQAKKNVEVAKLYVGGRLVSTAILEALSELSGGDVPVVMFLGAATPASNADSKFQFDSYFPSKVSVAHKDIDPQLLGLFEYESQKNHLFDFRKSPLAAYVYKKLGTRELHQALLKAKLMFCGQMSHEDFLNSLDKEMVKIIASACAKMVTTRKKALLKLVS